MDTQGLLLKKTLDVLEEKGFNVSVDTFRGRKNVQKLVYLLQVNGYPFSYRFRWYIRGPYSTNLTSTFMNVARDSSEFYDALADDYRLDDDLIATIDLTLENLEQAGIMRLPTFSEKENALDERLEAVASAKFLIDEEGFTLDEAMNELEKRKSYLEYDKNEILEYLKIE